MQGQLGPDKRKHPRPKVASLVVIKCELFVKSGKKESCEFRTHTEDISEGGINVLLEEELEKHSQVEVRLFLTGKLNPIECKGEVMWCEEVNPEWIKPRFFAVGIKFLDIKKEDKETIRLLVSCFLKLRKNNPF
jgi:c-di-GMP-binding flagellar brake protein YcgR